MLNLASTGTLFSAAVAVGGHALAEWMEPGALPKADGNALVRSRLHVAEFSVRVCLILSEGVALLDYDVVVNVPARDFRRVLGVYATLFFAAA